MAKNLDGKPIETCGECSKKYTCNPRLCIAENIISPTCPLPDWREPPTAAQGVKPGASYYPEGCDLYETLNDLAARVAALEEAAKSASDSDKAEEWPEVDILKPYALSGWAIAGYNDIHKAGEKRGRPLTEDQARGYARLINLIGRNSFKTSGHVSLHEIRRILKGE